MQTRLWRLLAVVPACVCLAAGASAGPRRTDPKAAANRAAGAPRPVGPAATPVSSLDPRATLIVGSAWTAYNTPIKQANLRLRDVVSGKVQATTVGNDAGEFSFENVPGGSYVVELLSGGRVVVVGNVFSIAAGERIATFVRTGTKVPWFNGFFNNAVSAVAATAASEGVTAIAPIARPVSPNK
jgi:hypothetical protein